MSLFLISSAVGMLLILLLWALRSSQNDSLASAPYLDSIENPRVNTQPILG